MNIQLMKRPSPFDEGSSNSKSLWNDPASRVTKEPSTVLPNRTTRGNQAKEDKIDLTIYICLVRLLVQLIKVEWTQKRYFIFS